MIPHMQQQKSLYGRKMISSVNFAAENLDEGAQAWSTAHFTAAVLLFQQCLRAACPLLL